MNAPTNPKWQKDFDASMLKLETMMMQLQITWQKAQPKPPAPPPQQPPAQPDQTQPEQLPPSDMSQTPS